MTVKNSDVYPVTPTADPRAQLTSPAIIEPGEEFWWSGRFFLPSDFPSSVPGWLTVMEGPYGRPFDGTPPWHIEVNGSTLRWQRNDTYNWDVPWQVPLIKNSWVSVMVHEQFGDSGFVEMWVDGQQTTFFGAGSINPNHEATTTRLAMATRDHSNDEGGNFTVIQSYREAGHVQQRQPLPGADDDRHHAGRRSKAEAAAQPAAAGSEAGLEQVAPVAVDACARRPPSNRSPAPPCRRRAGPSAPPGPASPTSSRIAAARAAGSSGATSRPQSSPTSSGRPPTRVAITARPCCMASEPTPLWLAWR